MGPELTGDIPSVALERWMLPAPMLRWRWRLGHWKFDLLREASAGRYAMTQALPRWLVAQAPSRGAFKVRIPRQATLVWRCLPPQISVPEVWARIERRYGCRMLARGSGSQALAVFARD